MNQRVNPRVNRDLPQQPPPVDHRSDDPQAMAGLVDVTTSVGWEDTIIASLKKRCRSIERHLAISQGINAVEIQRLQAQHELMEQIIADPKTFFQSDPFGSEA